MLIRCLIYRHLINTSMKPSPLFRYKLECWNECGSAQCDMWVRALRLMVGIMNISYSSVLLAQLGLARVAVPLHVLQG
ncbi:hypothetical protein PR048_031632 [Dryococelus australis]|uniref:Post-GPI attachment to proteins factor 3 n=1 Tax=Dryococelus australis TaxID=614101 RepID=A0ABQ9G6U8_9NEOP|nr:hypothetical protein PR048_031632 [Dryococelus australis]